MQNQSNSEAMEQFLDYWKTHLTNVPILELPSDRPRPAIPSFHGKTQQFNLSPDLTEGLKTLSQREGTSLFMTLIAAFQVLLYRYSGQDDIVIGTLNTEQNHLKHEGLTDILALRADISNNPNFCELLARTREIVLGAYAHQDIAFKKLLETLNLQHDHNPLFQVMFILHSISDDQPQSNEISTKFLQINTETSKFDLTFELTETLHGLAGGVQYATDLFEAATIERLVGHFQHLLEGIIANPEGRVSEFCLLTEPERQQLTNWNNTVVPFSSDKCIHELFEAQVAQTPQAIAVVYEDSQLTYAELNAQANQLAHYLRSLGVKPDTLVAICVERSLNMIVALLAIIKAGGAYIPLDPAYPKDRLVFMLEDSHPLALLTQNRLKTLFDGLTIDLPMIDLDNATPKWSSQPVSNLNRHEVGLTTKHLVYIIYTSGSTGKPKGVQIIHSAFFNFLMSMAQLLDITEKDVLLAVTTLSFDIAGLEIYLPLIRGAKIFVARRDLAIDGLSLANVLNQNSPITVMQATPATWRLLLAADWQGNSQLKVLCGGEALSRDLAIHLQQKAKEVWNLYGPTETTVWSTIYRLPDGITLPNLIPIGRAIANTQLYILDSHLQLVPIGVAGELHIGGDGLARGYLNRPELTAEKFIKHPFSDNPEKRLYKTGDLARWLPDGNIEYLGRNDFQVKIRGFRIELGDIDATLRQHPQLREVVTGVYEPTVGDKRLVAYIVPQNANTPSPLELRSFLKPLLPEFMIPSAFVFLDALPLTPNGKLDRKALPQPDHNQYEPDSNFVAPRNAVEAQLAKIWSHVLKIEHVGIHDNFFELGGHSLLAIQVIVRIREQLSVEISLNVLFNAPTIAELAKLMGNTSVSASHAKPITSQPRSTVDNDQNILAIFPASFSQQGLWLVDRLTGNTVNYNIFTAFRLQGKLDIVSLETAINTIIHRHEALRTYFAEQNGEPVQVIQSSFSIPLQVVDIREYSEQQKTETLEQFIQNNKLTVFDLEKLPLLKLQLLRLDEEEYIFSLTFYHIIFDGWSIDVFIRELSKLYDAFSQGQSSSLPELFIQYADYTVWQRESLQGEAREQLLTYWKTQLMDTPTLELITDRPRPIVQSYRGRSQPFNLSLDLSDKLKALSQQEGVTLFMTLLATFQVLLHRYSGQNDIVVGTPSAGRGHLELEELIGFFVNTLVLRVDVSGNPSFRELLARVRKVSLGAYANQDISFEKLVEVLNPKRDASRHPLFQVMFILQNAPDAQLQLNGINSEPLQFDTETSKFDLTCELFETKNGLSGRIEYATDLFDATTIDRFIGHFQTLLEAVVVHPEARLSEFCLLSESERKQLLVEWNNTEAPFPEDKCIHELFEAQVANTPQAVAVVYENKQFTYTELNAQANQLAHHLRQLGVKPDTLVAICVERSFNMLVALLAVLKAGAAYVPLNPVYPIDLLNTMIEDSEPVALITQDSLKNLFVNIPTSLPVINLDVDSSLWLNQSNSNLDKNEIGLKPTHLAYVIYTSGSTGKPKGVMTEHRGVCNMITDIKKRYEICPKDRMLQFAQLAFDVSVQEIFMTLSSGAALVLRNDDWLVGASNFWALCEKNGVTVVKLPTAFWQQLIQEDGAVIPDTIRLNIIGGEAVNSKVLAAWFERESYRPKLFNAYGPTETTVNSTIHETSADSLSWQSIGRPIANTRIYILDANNQPVPIGLAGELYIGGVGVGRGYLNRPDLTEERFIVDPFSKETNARMYKTGDLVRWLNDGTIEFLGRNDFQVKIRGFRIELGNIEAKIMEHPAVSKVAVLDREYPNQVKYLAAYLVLKENSTPPSVSELRAFLKERMPEFMVPSAFVFLDALPLTPNGKLNRKALPEPDRSQQEYETNFVTARNPVEEQLIEIWRRVLKIDRVSIHDNFFELGGHSLLAVNMIVEANKRFNTKLPLGAIYQSSTIAELGITISSSNQQPSWYSLVPVQTQGSRPILFAIHTISLVDLPRYLGKDQPLYFLRYGMAAEGNDSSVCLPSLEDLASHYIKEMQQLQPEGPYYMIGFSFGGVIAYEMARQLAENGQQVNFLGLMDTNLTREKLSLPLHQKLHKLFKLDPSQILERIKSKIDDKLSVNKYGTDFWPHFYTEAPDIACWMAYQPKSYNGCNSRIILFQGLDSDSVFSSAPPPEQAWRRLLGDKLEVQPISVSHYDIFREPHVRIIAEKLTASMDKAMNHQSQS